MMESIQRKRPSHGEWPFYHDEYQYDLRATQHTPNSMGFFIPTNRVNYLGGIWWGQLQNIVQVNQHDSKIS